MPYSVIESLALSKPCVVSDCDGNRDLIRDGYNGYVVKQNDVNSFVSKVKLLLNTPDLLHTLATNAQQSFQTDYNIQHNSKKLEEIYQMSIHKN